MDLTHKQTRAWHYLNDQHTRELIFGGGAGGGKSALGALWLLYSAMRYDNTRWLMGRAKLKTLKETTLNTFFQVAQMQGLKKDQHFTFNQQKGAVLFHNGSEIILKDLFAYPSDPNFDELGSLELTGAFIDECNQITKKAWQIVKSRIRYKLDDYGLTPKMLGTCNPAKNWVYADFYRPHKDGTLSEKKKFIQSLLNDNKHISKHYRENLLTLDQVSKERLLLGNWEYDDDPAKLINYNAIIDLFTNDHVKGGTKYITADIARLGSDKAVVIVWDGLRAIRIITLDVSRLNEIGDIIRELQLQHEIPNSCVIADEDGVGGGLIDYMKIRGFVNNSKALKDENYQNLKAQCYYKLAEYINQGRVYIDNEQHRDHIIEELETVKSYKVDADSKYRVLPKDKVKELIGRSPDYADALMMRMWYELNPPRTIKRRVY